MSDTHNKLTDRPLEEKRRFARIAGQFNHSWMSNTKWRQFFEAIHDADLRSYRCEYKCIDGPHVYSPYRFPSKEEALDLYLADGAMGCPLVYKWIEWIRVPRRFRPSLRECYVTTQDIEPLYALFQNSKSIHAVLDEEYLWFYGYTGKQDER